MEKTSFETVSKALAAHYEKEPGTVFGGALSEASKKVISDHGWELDEYRAELIRWSKDPNNCSFKGETRGV